MSQYRQPLDPDTALGIRISATISRHRYDTDPTTLLAELNEMAHGHPEILAEQAGGWVGYYGHDLGVQPALVNALRSLPGAEEWVALGQQRRAAPMHGAPEPPMQKRLR